MVQEIPPHQRLIGWNGLQFSLPSSWEVIVSGPCHLLIERNFQPVLEIRWDTNGKHSTDRIVETARKHFGDSAKSVQKVQVPGIYKSLAKRRGATGISWHENNSLDALLWLCHQCNAAIFCHLFPVPEITATEVNSLLESLQCHQTEDARTLWSVQDFQLSMPPGFTFIDHTFKAGLSRIGFQGDNLQLQFCRIAPATNHLHSSSLQQILRTLQGELPADEIVTDTSHCFECRSSPTTFRQLLLRFRRRRPFRLAKIWHDTTHNRLLSVTAESIQPIAVNAFHQLCNNYEIIPLKK